MARNRQPILDRGADFASRQRGLTLALMPSDQQNYPVSGGNRPFEPEIHRLPGTIEAVAVKVDSPVWFDPA